MTFNVIEFYYTAVPGAGLEPARPCGPKILSLVRLPITPPGQHDYIELDAG